MSGELVVAQAGAIAPAVAVEDLVQRQAVIRDAMARAMSEDLHYGKIPGTQKPTLLKAGAELVCTLFGLAPDFELVSSTEDWTGESHLAEPFFAYTVKCRLLYQGNMVASASGACNSWEARYRWRDAGKKCPHCGRETIIKGKTEYGGGWVCFAKKGGCGAKFSDNAPEIASQAVGRIPNPDICDLPNTLIKMAEKRALVAASLIATGASSMFTQDVEDMPQFQQEAPPPRQEPPAAAAAQKAAPPKQSPPSQAASVVPDDYNPFDEENCWVRTTNGSWLNQTTGEVRETPPGTVRGTEVDARKNQKRFFALWKEAFPGRENDEEFQRSSMGSALTMYYSKTDPSKSPRTVTSRSEVTEEEYDILCKGLQTRIDKQKASAEAEQAVAA